MGGNYISWEKVIDESTGYNYTEVYRASAKGGSYSLIATLDIAINEYFDQDGATTSYYKIRFKDAVTSKYSDYSEEMPASTEVPILSAYQLRQFMQITSQDAPDDSILAQYIADAEAIVNIKAPSLIDEENEDKLALKKLLVKYAAASLTIRNMDESHTSNPNTRQDKADKYWNIFEKLLNELAAADDVNTFFMKVRDDYQYSSWGQEDWSGA